jgi:HEAT repeat protein
VKNRPTTALALFLSLAGLACTLALPGRRGGTARLAPAAASSDASREASAFAALVEDGTRAPAAGLAPKERGHLLETMRSLGPPALARFLKQAVGKTSPEGPRLAALECLEGCATTREVGALIRLATPSAGAPSSRLCDALRSALLKTLERDARAFSELVPVWRSAGAWLRAELLAVVGERGDPAGLELLAWVATFESDEFHRMLADACLRIAPRAPGAESRQYLESLCALLGSQDTVCVQTISIALARARIEAAIPAWIELLGSASRGTHERARRSLEELTGLALGPTAERWSAWHASECAWFEEAAPQLFSELESDDDARVLTAVRALSTHRLHRDELSEVVGELLDHPSPAVRLCACSALQGLGSPLALPALAGALADEDEAVARGAWATLRHLTGLDLPLDETLWRERLAGS